MKKIFTTLILLMCILSFIAAPAMAAPDTTIITPAAKAQAMLEEHALNKISEQAKTHNPVLFTNEVPGVGGLKYEAEAVPKGFEHIPETVTMVSWNDEGRLHIRDIEHKTVTIQVPWTTLQDVEGFDGEHVRVWHYDDSGVCDGKWVQTVSNENGFAYLESVPFSEVVVGGFTGTYSKIENEIDITDTIGLGNTFDSDEISSLTLEITDTYATKTDPYDIDTEGLVFWGRFDDAGPSVIDYSGNGNNGTFTAATYSTGKYNNGGYFDGVDDEVGNIYGIDDAINNEVTIVAWVNITDHSTWGHIAGLGDPINSNDGYQLHLRDSDSSNQITMSVGTGSDFGWNRWAGLSTIDDGQMHQVAGTYNGSTICLYVDGSLKQSVDHSGTLTDTNSTFNIGESAYFDPFNGTIDNVMVYDYSLSEDEIKEHYYIKTSSLKVKSNSNPTYSDYWNSSADNLLNVPFGASELISSFTFAQSESIAQEGIIIYNPTNVLFDATATVGFTEDTYLIEEFRNEGFYLNKYAVEIQHTPSKSYEDGEISYNPTDSMCSDMMSESWTPHLTTNNPQASIKTFNQNSLIIDTGPTTAGTEYSYVVTAETSVGTPKTRSTSIIMDGIILAALIPLVSILSLIMGVVNGKSDDGFDLKKVVVTSGASFVTIAIMIVVVNAVMNAGVV